MSLDIISTLPSSIIENILCRVELQEAARTSVLSKEWRYKWTKIPILHFNHLNIYGESTEENEVSISEQTMASERNKMGERCKLFYIIYQILLMRQAPILEFYLSMEVDKTCIEIDHIINYLSRNNALQKLRLDLSDSADNSFYWVPFSIFSLHHLTDLYLHDCDLNHQPTFNGFPSLTTLYLKDVYISAKSLLHLLSNCPLLKDLTLMLHEEHIICDDDDKYTVVDLFKCLPVIERLNTWSWITKCFVVDSVPQELPISLINLKYLSMDCLSCADKNELNFLAFLMSCSPNIEKIRIESDSDFEDGVKNSVISEAYSDVWLEHLTQVVFWGFNNMKPDSELVKFILAKSPKLKIVVLHMDSDNVVDNEESNVLRTLLRTPPASPVVKIIV